MRIQDVLSLVLLGISLTLCPWSMTQTWSSIIINAKSPIEGCRSMFEQSIGLTWAIQCNCDPELGNFLCNHVDVNKLPPQYSFLPMGGFLLRIVNAVGLASTLVAIFFIFYKTRTPDTDQLSQNYKPYITWMTLYTNVLYLTALLFWTLVIKNSLNSQHGGKTQYKNETGWVLCFLCTILTFLSAVIQLSLPSEDNWEEDMGDYYGEGDMEGDYYDDEFESESGG